MNLKIAVTKAVDTISVGGFSGGGGGSCVFFAWDFLHCRCWICQNGEGKKGRTFFI